MKSKIDSLNEEINQLSIELQTVMESLEEMRKKQSSHSKIKNDALLFIEKSEKVIELAERGEVEISPEQKDKLVKTLLKIQTIFKAWRIRILSQSQKTIWIQSSNSETLQNSKWQIFRLKQIGNR